MAWTIAGTAFGVMLMVTRTPVFAESGGKPDEISWYAFWVPIFAIGGLVGGAPAGAVYALLTRWSMRWADLSETKRSVLCGAGAALAVGVFAFPMLPLLVPLGALTGWVLPRFTPTA